MSRRVAVAISNAPESSEFERTSLDTLFLQLCETMLAAGFEVAHGGDHRRGGFIAQLGQAASGSIGYRGGRVVNYLTTSDRATTERTGFIEGVAVEEVKVEPVANEPADVTRSRELSEMRSRMTMESLGRVVACGRILGSQGVAPGVLEEAYGSMVAKRPVYVVGGFRGAAEVIANAIRGEADLEVRAALSTDEGYVRRLAAVASSVTANTMLDAFKTAGPGGLNNGLGEPDNLLLLASTDRAQIVRLIMSGLRQVAANC